MDKTKCPNCGHAITVSRSMQTSRFYVHCSKCGHTGPSRILPVDAVNSYFEWQDFLLDVSDWWDVNNTSNKSGSVGLVGMDITQRGK